MYFINKTTLIIVNKRVSWGTDRIIFFYKLFFIFLVILSDKYSENSE